MFISLYTPSSFYTFFTHNCCDFSCPEVSEVSLEELFCDSGIWREGLKKSPHPPAKGSFM